MRHYKNVTRTRNSSLQKAFSWLAKVDENDLPKNVFMFSISAFDHWLSVDEADRLLQSLTVDEQRARDQRHFELRACLAKQTEILNFSFGGRKGDALRVRQFLLDSDALDYLRPESLGGAKRRSLRRFLMPEYGAVFYEGYDDTSHIYFLDHVRVEPILTAAVDAGLYILPN